MLCQKEEEEKEEEIIAPIWLIRRDKKTTSFQPVWLIRSLQILWRGKRRAALPPARLAVASWPWTNPEYL